jgi:hypothetical protein
MPRSVHVKGVEPKRCNPLFNLQDRVQAFASAASDAPGSVITPRSPV